MVGRHGTGLVDASEPRIPLAMQFILVSSSYFSILELIWLEHMHSWKRRFTHGFQRFSAYSIQLLADSEMNAFLPKFGTIHGPHDHADFFLGGPVSLTKTARWFPRDSPDLRDICWMLPEVVGQRPQTVNESTSKDLD